MTAADLAQSIRRELPYLRRYARALTGSQTAGDNYAVATLEAILSDRSLMDTEDTRIGLFRTFHAIWQSSGQPVEQESQTPQEARAQAHLRGLTPNSREALLLRTIEELRYEQIATIMQIDQDEAEELVQIAMTEMSNSMAGKVMVIEDETIIAMDLKGIVQSMGHDVTGIARTHSAAVELAHGKRPDLILADIQLADGSSGIDAVNELLRDMGDIPVIFITAFPERLLTGERPEPAFLISKPYTEEQVRSAVSQAMFFSSTEGLTAA
ncbi:response regulator [Paracoccus yeei]|jgi:CheY-like chemotaxis protein|uniref:Response regulator n=2 Tax=Paracoccus TaxID=265 RepID=A0A1V0GRW9_9RHOB|nr:MULTISPECIES: response regulator [Paracoccus]ARC36606.1 response regulator [Paracoccus yeei]ATQ55343.1 response regulator [Paracoccus yeei]AWX93084.1 response regulator [Paracoccus mutanolyticus]OWJ93311.1 response regulator [Paracoccus yeei]QEU07350.1 response regulator [Paracoccus yeei]